MVFFGFLTVILCERKDANCKVCIKKVCHKKIQGEGRCLKIVTFVCFGLAILTKYW